MMEVFVTGVGIAGPGLDGWEAARPILSGQLEHRVTAISQSIPSILSAAERRRSSQSARLAIMACRSVHEMIWTILLVALLGYGMLPGVLALTLFCIGFAGKLFTALGWDNPEVGSPPAYIS